MFTAPVLRGLLRPKLLLGCDHRILLAAVLVALAGIFAWPLFFVTGLLYAIGVALGKVSPYIIDELVTYMGWRKISWSGVHPDEGFTAEPNRKLIKHARKVAV